MRLRAILAAGGIAGLMVLGAAAADDDALGVARKFCTARMANDEAATRALITDDLARTIAEAEARNKLFADANPDDKPPLGDGIPWQAFPDVAPSCKPGNVHDGGNRIMVDVAYGFPDARDAGWTDRIVLVDQGTLKLDDVLYQQFPTDSTQHGLRRTLASIFDQ